MVLPGFAGDTEPAFLPYKIFENRVPRNQPEDQVNLIPRKTIAPPPPCKIMLEYMYSLNSYAKSIIILGRIEILRFIQPQNHNRKTVPPRKFEIPIPLILDQCYQMIDGAMTLHTLGTVVL